MAAATKFEGTEQEVRILCSGRQLMGTLVVPRDAKGMVLFAHGSGSGRFSPRNQFVAKVLHDAGIGTLLMDLLGEDEAEDRRRVFDIELLAGRLMGAAFWLSQQPETQNLNIGYFGASTGAAAALVAASQRPELVYAVVSRGGRPDLAGQDLKDVQAPTLLIVGELDREVLELNRLAMAQMHCATELVVVPGATHLFPEPGTLEEVARLASLWFERYLRRPADR